MSTVRIDYYGVEGEGRTVTDAKRDAGRKIEAALAGSYTPEILVWRGYAILIYREPTGWCNRLIADPERGIVEGRVWGTNYGSKEEAVSYAQDHLADLGWQESDGEEPPPFLKGRKQIGDYRSKVQFRQRYNFARRRGFSDCDAHSYAGHNPSRPELIAQVEQATAVA